MCSRCAATLLILFPACGAAARPRPRHDQVASSAPNFAHDGRPASTACADPATCAFASARTIRWSADARTSDTTSTTAASACFGADVAEQLNGGQVVSAFGNLYEGIDIDTTPAIDAHAARQTIEERAGVEIGREPELVILPTGRHLSPGVARPRRHDGDVREYFVDARDGSIAFDFSDRKTQSAVGRRATACSATPRSSACRRAAASS